MAWNVVQLLRNDPRLEEVVAIWGLNRSTLGLFPRGAFEDCVNQDRLIVAIDPAGRVAGYLTFRVQRRLNAVAIIHLCVRAEHRGAGVSDALADWLKSHARDLQLSSVRLKCRRDYNAENLWQRLGFVARADVQGRGLDGDELTIWVHSLGATNDLFSQTGTDEGEGRLSVVIDANVFFDLHGADADTDNESKVLLEPWVGDSIKVYVANQLHNEINRCPFPDLRATYHRRAENYAEIPHDATKAATYERDLETILGSSSKGDSGDSDRKQLARSAAGEADIFLTRDKELLEASPEIESRLGIKVMKPSDLSGRLDEAERTAAYQPTRLFATTLTRSAVRAAEVESIVARVQLSGRGEKPHLLESEIRQHLTKVRSDPQSELDLVRDAEGSIAALFVRVKQGPGADGLIALLRIPKTSLDRTLVRHLLLHAIQSNATEGRPRLIIGEPFVTPLIAEALIELGFARDARGWVRHTPRHIGSRTDLIGLIQSSGGNVDAVASMTAGETEAQLWPAKVMGEGISSFVVPILPGWAAQLFDASLAAGDLFGAMARLALNRENVYYRRPKNGSFRFPARLLWYVAKDSSEPGTMAIRACSRLLSFEVGPAKVLFGRYRRIGVYEWPQILETANGDKMGEIMALRFADTELFSTPVEVPVLRGLGIKSLFPSPTEITEDQFAAIYRLGTAKIPS